MNLSVRMLSETPFRQTRSMSEGSRFSNALSLRKTVFASHRFYLLALLVGAIPPAMHAQSSTFGPASPLKPLNAQARINASTLPIAKVRVANAGGYSLVVWKQPNGIFAIRVQSGSTLDSEPLWITDDPNELLVAVSSDDIDVLVLTKSGSAGTVRVVRHDGSVGLPRQVFPYEPIDAVWNGTHYVVLSRGASDTLHIIDRSTNIVATRPHPRHTFGSKIAANSRGLATLIQAGGEVSVRRFNREGDPAGPDVWISRDGFFATLTAFRDSFAIATVSRVQGTAFGNQVLVTLLLPDGGTRSLSAPLMQSKPEEGKIVTEANGRIAVGYLVDRTTPQHQNFSSHIDFFDAWGYMSSTSFPMELAGWSNVQSVLSAIWISGIEDGHHKVLGAGVFDSDFSISRESALVRGAVAEQQLDACRDGAASLAAWAETEGARGSRGATWPVSTENLLRSPGFRVRFLWRVQSIRGRRSPARKAEPWFSGRSRRSMATRRSESRRYRGMARSEKLQSLPETHAREAKQPSRLRTALT